MESTVNVSRGARRPLCQETKGSIKQNSCSKKKFVNEPGARWTGGECSRELSKLEIGCSCHSRGEKRRAALLESCPFYLGTELFFSLRVYVTNFSCRTRRLVS